MRENRKTAPLDYREGGSGQMKFDGFQELSKADFTIEFQPVQGTIAFLLHKGRDNALTTAELSRISGLHPRNVRAAVQRERLRGAPILSDSGGFWLAENSGEVLRCAGALHRRAVEIHKTARALQRITSGGANND